MSGPRKLGGSKPGELRGNAGKGRKKGVPNKVTGTMRELILGALEAKGGQAYLERMADDQPAAFMGLLSKLLPQDASLIGNITFIVDTGVRHE